MPKDEQFDVILGDSDFRELVISQFAECQTEVGDILDINVEFSTDPQGLFRFAGSLASVPRDETADLDGRMRAIYRGLIFGLQLASEMKSEEFNSIPTGSIFDGLPRQDGMTTDEAITCVTGEYLETRPAIDGFLQVFSNIVNKGDYPEQTAEASALMLMLVERQLGKQSIMAELDSLDIDGFVR